MKQTTKRSLGSSIGLYLVLCLGSVVMLVPFLWMILTSFKTYAETVRIPVVWFPAEWNAGTRP